MGPHKLDIVVVGGVNWDYVVRGPILPRPGETIAGEQLQEGPGGKGGNQAVAAARLGSRVALLARVGQDERGDEALRRLRIEGVFVDHVARDSVIPTGVALVMVDAQGEKQIMTAPGANDLLSIAEVKNAAGVIESSRVLLAQLEVPLDAVTAAIEIAAKAGAQVVLDPAPAVPLSDQLLQHVTVIRPNAAEAEVLTKIPVEDRASASRAAHQLLDRGVAAAVVPAGNEGVLVVTRAHEHWLPRVPVHSVDSTGAGDAFAAALAVMLAEGKPLLEAATFANAAAAQKTAVMGAQAGLPKRNTVLAMLSTLGNPTAMPS